MIQVSKGMHKAKASSSLACPISEDHGLVEVYGKPTFRSVVQVSASKTRPLPKNSGWKKFSLEEALNSLEQMPQPPSVEDFTCILHKCRRKKNLALALRLHAYMRKSGLAAHTSLGNYLVPMLVEAGSMPHAQQAFDRLVVRNVYSWTSLITGYIECGKSQHALNLYQKMQEDCVHPSEYTFVALLKACARLKDAERGRRIHTEIVKKGVLESDLVVGNTLVDMYAKCGQLQKAQEVFDKLPGRDVVSWNALIAGYAKQGLGDIALSCLEQMQLQGISPDAITFVCCLKACGNTGAIDKGEEMHADITKKGFLEKDIVVGNTLVDMYAKIGLLTKAQEVFDNLHVRDVVSWNVLMAGYAKHGLGVKALNYFGQMKLEGISPDALSFVCSLQACGSIGAIDKGKEIHADIDRKGLLGKDLVVGNSLVDMYAKCGSLVKAQEVFDKIPLRDVITWNALVAAYAEDGLGEEALDCFEQMQLEGVCPNAVTFSCSFKACGRIGAIDKAQQIHAEVSRKGLETDLVLGSTLVGMYAKWGLLVKSQEAFDKLPVRDVVSWNALIAGYAHLGESENALQMFERMSAEGVKPDGVTFLSVLTVCNHTGLVDKGQKYFEAMSKIYGITSTIEHHTCIVDLLGRAGQLEEALATMKNMPFHPDLVVWLIVLGVCRKWGNVEIGRQAFEHAVQLNEKDATAYVLLSNIFAEGTQEDQKR